MMMLWLPICRTLTGTVVCAALAAYSSSSACFHSLLGANADDVTVSAPTQAPM